MCPRGIAHTPGHAGGKGATDRATDRATDATDADDRRTWRRAGEGVAGCTSPSQAARGLVPALVHWNAKRTRG